MIHPNDLYNALQHLGLKPNEAMNLSEEEEKRLMDIYEEVVLSYFRALFPKPTNQNFIGKRRDEYGRMLVDIICRSCGKQITVYNRRRVFCQDPAPCKNNFNRDREELFEFLDIHKLNLTDRIKKQPTRKTLVVLLEEGKARYDKNSLSDRRGKTDH